LRVSINERSWAGSEMFALFQSLSNPIQMSPEVKDPPDCGQVLLNRVIHGVRESLG
jgi:hypothetical protein